MIVLTWKFELYKVVAGLFSVLLFLWAGADAINVTKNVCLEPGCVLAAADIINAIDEKVDPCTGKCATYWSADSNLDSYSSRPVENPVESRDQSQTG